MLASTHLAGHSLFTCFGSVVGFKASEENSLLEDEPSLVFMVNECITIEVVIIIIIVIIIISQCLYQVIYISTKQIAAINMLPVQN